MVSSGMVSSDLNSINKEFTNYYKTISGISDFVWQGVSKNNLLCKSEQFINEYKSPINTQMTSLVSAINLYEEYKIAKESIDSFKKTLEIAVAKEDEDSINYCKKGIKTNEIKMSNLKEKIDSLLETIVSLKLESANNVVSSVSSGEVKSLVNDFDNGSLRKLGENENLENYYDKGYIQELLNNIKNNPALSGREKAVNSALTLIQLAADKGVKLDYDYGGAHDGTVVTTDDVLRGVDCSTFASFVINQGTTQNVTSMTTATLQGKYAKYTTDYSNAKPGDLLNVNNGTNQHVEVIIENNSDEGYFITAEARSSSHGIELNKTSYNDCKNQGQKVYDMDEVYDN